MRKRNIPGRRCPHSKRSICAKCFVQYAHGWIAGRRLQRTDIANFLRTDSRVAECVGIVTAYEIAAMISRRPISRERADHLRADKEQDK